MAHVIHSLQKKCATQLLSLDFHGVSCPLFSVIFITLSIRNLPYTLPGMLYNLLSFYFLSFLLFSYHIHLYLLCLYEMAHNILALTQSSGTLLFLSQLMYWMPPVCQKFTSIYQHFSCYFVNSRSLSRPQSLNFYSYLRLWYMLVPVCHITNEKIKDNMGWKGKVPQMNCTALVR